MTLEEAGSVVANWAHNHRLIQRVFFFGSRVRQEHRPDSDLDIAIELILSDPDESFAQWAFERKSWLRDLERLLPWKIDLQHSSGEATPTIASGIARSSILLYERDAQPSDATDRFEAGLRPLLRAQPDLTTREYARIRRIQLGQSLEPQAAVFLDTKYWIIARDVLMNRRNDPDSIGFANLLRRLVHSRRIFCPISDSIFLELLKQQDPTTRKATAELIDELSLGITLAPENERVGTEMAHFFHSLRQPESVYPLHWLVWSKLSYVLGVLHPENTGLDTDTERVVQKAFFDHMWDTSLTRMTEFLTLGPPAPQADFHGLAVKTNEANRQQAPTIRSFERAYTQEIAGALSIYIGRAVDILEDLLGDGTDTPPPPFSEEERNLHQRNVHALLVEAFRCGGIATQLPTLHVLASCHAMIRHDKTRKLDPNDFPDFHHAAAALGYCDVFLTDRPLEILLKSRHLDRLLNCRVISAVPEAFRCLIGYDG